MKFSPLFYAGTFLLTVINKSAIPNLACTPPLFQNVRVPNSCNKNDDDDEMVM